MWEIYRNNHKKHIKNKKIKLKKNEMQNTHHKQKTKKSILEKRRAIRDQKKK